MEDNTNQRFSSETEAPNLTSTRINLPENMRFLAYPEFLCRKWYWLWRSYALVRLPIELVAATAIITGIITFYYAQKDRANQTAIQQVMLMAEASKLSAMGYNAGSPTIAMIMTLLNKQNASMQYMTLTSMTLPERLELSNAKLDDAKFFGTTLLNANLSGANMQHALFSEADVSGSNFSKANLTMTKWINSTLNNVDFSNANLLYADLRQTRLDHANFENADVAGANFENSSISQLQINQACQRRAGPAPILPKRLHWKNSICD